MDKRNNDFDFDFTPIGRPCNTGYYATENEWIERPEANQKKQFYSRDYVDSYGRYRCQFIIFNYQNFCHTISPPPLLLLRRVGKTEPEKIWQQGDVMVDFSGTHFRQHNIQYYKVDFICIK